MTFRAKYRLSAEERKELRRSNKHTSSNLPAEDGGVVKTCRFPLWGDQLPPLTEIERHFCGKRVKKGSSYCEKHHKLCHQKPDPSQPLVRWNYSGRIINNGQKK